MTPAAFVCKSRASELKESSATHEHFIDLCRLLGDAHAALDTAVTAAYRWDADICEGEALHKLLALNFAASE